MAGRPAASVRETDVNRESSFLDLIMRRLESSGDQGAASSSIESLDAPAMSPTNSANPWQYLSPSDPSSPILQRDFYNLTHSPLASENAWMEQEQQQRVPMLQADEVGQRGGARGTLLQRRRETINPDSDWPSEVPGSHGPAALPIDAMLYEELAAAWYRNGHLRAPSVSPRGDGLQGMWEGLVQAYASVERWGNSSGNPSAGFASMNPQFDPNVRAAFDRMGANDEAATRRQQSMPRCEADGQFAEFSNSEAAADMDTRTVPSLPVDEGGNAVRSGSDILGSPSTSLLSGSGGDDSDDEECNEDPPLVLDSNRKRKTPAASEEDDSARTSESSGFKITAPSKGTTRPRKKRNTKRSREPRYAIKTRTDVDIMDDGFKWRKYGQKAVKNSPHPRNYYRCTTPQCPVRKRVERASEDSGMVITTYEGTHSHHTPGFIHRPAPEKTPHPSNPPPGVGVGFGHHRTSSSLLPLPPEFTTLAALHQMRSLQHILAQQQMQMPPMPGRLQLEGLLRAQQFFAQQQMQIPPMPGRLQLESLLRAQQFLGLHDPDVKPGVPFPNFDGNHFMSRHAFPYRPNFQNAPPMRPQQQQRPRAPPEPQADGDLVRRVLEAEESARDVESPRESIASPRMSSAPQNDFVSQIQSSLRSRVELEARRRAALLERAAAVPRASGPVSRTRSANSGERPARRRAPSPTEDELVDGLLQEMAKRGE